MLSVPQPSAERDFTAQSDKFTQLSGVTRTVGALAVLALALAVRMLLDRWLGETILYPTVITAVVLAAWYCGPGPAIVISVLGYPAVEYLIRDAPFRGGELGYVICSLALYAGVVCLMVCFVGRLRRAHDQLRAAQHEL